jgi:tetratricopeptide (TPR) repeat protein
MSSAQPGADMPVPAPSPLHSEVQRLDQLARRGNHAASLAGAEALLIEYPENRDLLLIAIKAERTLGHTPAALARVDTLAALQPDFSQMWQERGLCHIAGHDAPAAIAALQQAVAINPALPLAWRMLEGLFLMTGDKAQAETAAAHSQTLKALPPAVVHATSLFADGGLDAAERIVREFLLTQGDHPEAMRLLARIAFARKVYDDAETLYDAVLTLAPDYRAARAEYVQTLIARYKYAAARDALAPLLTEGKEPDAAVRFQQATIAIGLGDHHPAIALYRRLIAELPPKPALPAQIAHLADMHLYLGHALRAVGELPQAIAAYRHAAEIRPDFGDAWWSLANLKTYRFGDDEIAAIRALEADPAIAAIDRVNLSFALGKALEDRRDHAGSWAAYARGNAVRRSESGYRPAIFETNTREQKLVCTAAFFAARADWGDPAPDPIFILGLPRSGSTLIEQILASHSQVEATFELHDISRLAFELQGREAVVDPPLYPANLVDLDAVTVRDFGQRFLAETRVHRLLGRPFFIDKMPNNFRHIGLIHLILPNATIIDARRNPMDCCFSNLKQLFAQGQEFTYSIEDIARYYRTYLDLMRHWDAVLPGRVVRVVNEDLIADPEMQIRLLLDRCELSFEPGCLNFHQSGRSVRTPSSEQVRRPVNRDGMDQWKPYAQWLGPLQDALGDALDTWRD